MDADGYAHLAALLRRRRRRSEIVVPIIVPTLEEFSYFSATLFKKCREGGIEKERTQIKMQRRQRAPTLPRAMRSPFVPKATGTFRVRSLERVRWRRRRSVQISPLVPEQGLELAL